MDIKAEYITYTNKDLKNGEKYMAGLILKAMDVEIKQREVGLADLLLKKAHEQGVVDHPNEGVVRDILPLTDLGGTTTGASSASGGFRTEEWRVDMRTYQRDASTAVSSGAYNEVVNVDLNKSKVLGFVGVKKNGEDAVATIRFSLGSGTKIKDIWQLDSVPEEGSAYAENPIIYNATHKAKVEYYLKSPAIIYHQLIGKIAEPRGNVILGAE